MAWDGGWPGVELSRLGGCGRRRDHLYCNWRALNLSPPGASHFLHRSFFRIPFIGFHLHPFLPCSTSSLLYFPPVVCLSCSSAGSRFMRSLSIFHDSMFYCLYESFYPAFLLDVLSLPETLSCAPLHYFTYTLLSSSLDFPSPFSPSARFFVCVKLANQQNQTGPMGLFRNCFVLICLPVISFTLYHLEKKKKPWRCCCNKLVGSYKKKKRKRKEKLLKLIRLRR